MKTCQIVPSLEARHGGPSKSVLGLSTALVKEGLEVELLTTEPGEGWERTEGQLKIEAFHRDWPGTLCSSKGLNAHLRTTTADIIHHHSLWLRTLHYANRTARRLGASFIVSPRGMTEPWAWNHNHRKKAFARKVIHPGAFEAVDGWHATSEQEAESLRALGFKQPICVAPNGIAAPTDEGLVSARDYWHALVPATAQRPVALFYSRFHKKKRLIELIDTWFEYAPEDWLLLMVGIPEEFTPKTIEDYVLRSGKAGRVRAYDGAGRPPPYAVASLFLLPSHSENFGQAIIEALASGVSALVTDTTPWAGLNRTGAGWCVPWADYGASLREATSEGADALRRRGTMGRDWVLDEFSWSKSAHILSDFYSALRRGSQAAHA